MVDTASCADELHKVSLFSQSSPASVQGLAARAIRRSYRRGQVLFQAGDASDTLMVVVRGRIQILATSADGAELTFDVIRAGEVLGTLGVVDGGPRSTSAISLEDADLILLPRQSVLDVLSAEPATTHKLLLNVAASLRRLTDATADLVFLDLPRRLAKLLVEHPTATGRRVDLGLTQSQVATVVGGTRQSVNAALGGFARRGWIRVDGQIVVLLDPESLHRFAGTRPPHPGAA